MGVGLGYVFEELENQQQLYLYLIDTYMREDTPYKICAGRILEKLFEIESVSEVKKLIT